MGWLSFYVFGVLLAAIFFLAAARPENRWWKVYTKPIRALFAVLGALFWPILLLLMVLTHLRDRRG